ncbi:hypothetical protein BDW02DRAFT_92023 [Decorospora gaudefroyi]|uniref:Uncharacterized protein n=1 Tax=Decorospora gaudefroyi TaxID=184978 RepID=A0A6A5K7Q9_9PLEO|nr:hypothetical protein BDW02DRAFT_92023 [Decorospora gaudefroyi]
MLSAIPLRHLSLALYACQRSSRAGLQTRCCNQRQYILGKRGFITASSMWKLLGKKKVMQQDKTQGSRDVESGDVPSSFEELTTANASVPVVPPPPRNMEQALQTLQSHSIPRSTSVGDAKTSLGKSLKNAQTDPTSIESSSGSQDTIVGGMGRQQDQATSTKHSLKEETKDSCKRPSDQYHSGGYRRGSPRYKRCGRATLENAM